MGEELGVIKGSCKGKRVEGVRGRVGVVVGVKGRKSKG